MATPIRRWTQTIPSILTRILAITCGFSLSAMAQLPSIPTIPGVHNPFSSSLKLDGEDPVSTKFADTENKIVVPDSFSPKRFKPLLRSPRSAAGSFLLSPGAYEAVVKSFCVMPGTHGPSRGDGYLYAPLKGSRATIILGLLRRTVKHPEITQEQVQLLIWMIEARSKFDELQPSLQLAALAMLTKKELFELNGGALGLIPKALWDRATNSIPPEGRRILEIQAQLRSKLADANATYAEIEKIAVLAGPAKRDGPIIPRGRWSSHPGGFLVRYMPDTYKETRIQVYVPEPRRQSRRMSAHRLEQANFFPRQKRGDNGASRTSQIEYDPTQDVAVPADTYAQRLGMSNAPWEGGGGGEFGGGGAGSDYGDKWSCDAQCNVQQIDRNAKCPDRVFGSASSSSEESACVDAKRDATQKTPNGCYPRHCKCNCSKQ